MKKICFFLALVLFISIIFNSIALSYSNSDYSIDIPDGYTNDEPNSFTDEEGRNINIVIGDSEISLEGEIYTEKNLQYLIDVLYDSMETTRQNLKDSLLEQKKNNEIDLTEEEIIKYADSFKIESTVNKEICTFSKNNYKAFHISNKYKLGTAEPIIEQFIVITKTTQYSLTIKYLDQEEYESGSCQSVIDSFTINNYEEPIENSEEEANIEPTVGSIPETTTNSSKNKALIGIGVAVVTGVLGGILSAILRRKRR